MTSDESAYEALAEAHDDARWAFGTGFTDPLHGVDTAVPDGVDRDGLVAQCIALADDALVLSHRLQQWISRLPELEEETAIANIALDLLGQARLLYSRAGQVEGRTEDEYAYWRGPDEFRNTVVAELPIGDFADLIVRVQAVAEWRTEAMHELTDSADQVLRAIAAKALPELRYHREYADLWLRRLAGGTSESKQRLGDAFTRLRPHLDDMEAGRNGAHSAALADLLDEMQSLARAHPEATW